MIPLVATHKIQLVTDGVCSVDAIVGFADLVAGVATGRAAQATHITTATTTDIAATPSGSDVRNIQNIHIRNTHATASVTVTTLLNQNGTLFEWDKITLQPGDQREYLDGVGWYLVATLQPLKKDLAADQSNSTVTLTEVTGLTIPLPVGAWAFRYDILYTSSSASNGVRFSVDFSGTVTSFVANRLFMDTSAAAASATPDQDQVLSTGAIFGGFAARAKSQLGWGVTLSVDTVSLDMYEIIEGLCVVTVAGNLSLWHGSETAVASTIKAGSKVRIG